MKPVHYTQTDETRWTRHFTGTAVNNDIPTGCTRWTHPINGSPAIIQRLWVNRSGYSEWRDEMEVAE